MIALVDGILIYGEERGKVQLQYTSGWMDAQLFMEKIWDWNPTLLKTTLTLTLYSYSGITSDHHWSRLLRDRTYLSQLEPFLSHQLWVCQIASVLGVSVVLNEVLWWKHAARDGFTYRGKSRKNYWKAVPTHVSEVVTLNRVRFRYQFPHKNRFLGGEIFINRKLAVSQFSF